MAILRIDVLLSMEIAFKRCHPPVISCGISITRAESVKCSDKFLEWENLDKSQSLQFGVIFTLWFLTRPCPVSLLFDSWAAHRSFGHRFGTELLARDEQADSAVPTADPELGLRPGLLPEVFGSCWLWWAHRGTAGAGQASQCPRLSER